MIAVDLPNNSPMAGNGIACAIVSPLAALPSVGVANLFCYCKYECEYEETAFALPGGTTFENDKSMFPFLRVVAATDTIEIELYKDGVKIADLNDNTLGVFTDFGGHLTQLDVKTFVVDWELVFTAHGTGRYQIQAVQVIAGVSLLYESQMFRLKKFDLQAANGTVRIETIQNGCIEGGFNKFDYTGMQWESMHRVDGSVSGREPKLIDDTYKNSKQEYQQIQTTIFSAYTFSTDLIPKIIQDRIIFDGMLANEIFFTDYNIFSNHVTTNSDGIVYNKIDVKIDEFGKPTYPGLSQKGLFIINFTDRAEDGRKRNFK